jgi:hypothetical protein
MLQDANAMAADIWALNASRKATRPARLDAVDGRLVAMLQAVNQVSAALENFMLR